MFLEYVQSCRFKYAVECREYSNAKCPILRLPFDLSRAPIC